MKFTDESCFSCGSKFEEKDDVVICPECGTPYHRECYNQNGECINNQYHESGQKWNRNSEESIKKEDISLKVCPACMHTNDINDEVCGNCGQPMSEEKNSSAETENEFEKIFGNIDSPFLKPYLGFNPDEDLGGATIKEVSQFVGSNTLYYLPLFKKMKDVGSKISLNLSCFLFPYFYFANRKMWFWGILSAILTILLELPYTIYTLGKSGMELPYIQDALNTIMAEEKLLLAVNEVCVIAGFFLKTIFCVFANWLYFRFTIKSIKKIKLAEGGTAAQSSLKAAGGINPSNILSMFFIIMGISLAICIILLMTLSSF